MLKQVKYLRIENPIENPKKHIFAAPIVFDNLNPVFDWFLVVYLKLCYFLFNLIYSVLFSFFSVEICSTINRGLNYLLMSQ